jgi:DNA mismatch endonuclease, patch repair protein
VVGPVNPPASSPAVRAMMQAQPSRDTGPELAVRAALRAAGLTGYRVHHRPLPRLGRTADVVFTRQRVAVFVDGCFWHGCPDHGRAPNSNPDWWLAKIAGNRRRDAETDLLLEAAGWTGVRAWEHDDPADVTDRLRGLLRAAA